MSSSSELATTADPTSTPSSKDPSSSLLSSQYALYLYTFLVTLILLLIVAAGIVLRVFIMRRRRRRSLQEAIQNGTYIPPNVRAGRPRLGEKPILYDVSVTLRAHPEYKLETTKEGLWEDLTPVSVALVRGGSVNVEVANSQRHTPSTSRFLSLFHRNSQQIAHSPPNLDSSPAGYPRYQGPLNFLQSSSNVAADAYGVKKDLSRIAVLVEMPSAQGSQHPILEFGIMSTLVSGRVYLHDDQAPPDK